MCDEGDIGENEMKQYEIDEDSKVLVVKQNGVISAIGTKCSHYGALLSTGALSEGLDCLNYFLAFHHMKSY